jgi:predicted ATPase
MHSFYTYLEDNPGTRPEPVFHEMSHGESFLAILDTRFDRPGSTASTSRRRRCRSRPS